MICVRKVRHCSKNTHYSVQKGVFIKFLTMVFIACSKAENIDTMKRRLMLALELRVLGTMRFHAHADKKYYHNEKILKNKVFNKWVEKEGLSDDTLRAAVDEMERGLIYTDLSGHVVKNAWLLVVEARVVVFAPC